MYQDRDENRGKERNSYEEERFAESIYGEREDIGRDEREEALRQEGAKQEGFAHAGRQESGERPLPAAGEIPGAAWHRERILVKKNKKSGRIAAIISAGLLFGSVSGVTMTAVHSLIGARMGRERVQEQRIEQVRSEAMGSRLRLNEATKSEETDAASEVYVHSADVSGIVERAMPFVVAINGTTKLKTYSWFGESREIESPSSGSGIIIGKNEEELLVVTNNHVVNDANSLSVVFIDEESVPATVKGGDSESDVAIIALKISDIKESTLDRIDVATIGDSDALKVGQGVIAIGNALGYGQSVTVGYVSALNRDVETREGIIRNLLQTDAAINPGNSGGALLNMEGEVIGINSAKYSAKEVEGMGYAIPISAIREIITELSNKKTRTVVDEEQQGYLGIQGQNIDAEMAQLYDMPKGVYVYRIVEGGAASESELREKDVILKLNGQTVRTMEDLKKELSYYAGGEQVQLTIKRLEGSEYEEREVEITLGYRSELKTE